LGAQLFCETTPNLWVGWVELRAKVIDRVSARLGLVRLVLNLEQSYFAELPQIAGGTASVY